MTLIRLATAARIATLSALPLSLAACVVAPPPPPGPVVVAPRPVVAPPPVYAPPPPRRCWTEARRVWSRDQWGRPVQVVQQQQVCR